MNPPTKTIIEKDWHTKEHMTNLVNHNLGNY